MTTDKPRPAADAPAGSHSLGALTPTGNAAIKGIFFIMFAAALYFAKGLLIPVVLAVLVWLTFGPWVRWLAKRRMPSALSAAFIVIGLTVVVSGAAFVASGPVARWMDDIPKMSSELRSKLSELRQPMEEVAKASDALEEVGKNIDGKKAQQVVVRGPGLLFTLAQNAQYMATTVAATLVLLYFMLASGSHFHVRLVESFDSLADKKKALELVMLIENDVSRYLMSVTVINFCLGAVVATWGVTAGVMNFMPYIGPVIGVVLIGVASIIEFNELTPMLLMPGIYAFCTIVEGQLITPSVLGRRFDINPVVILLAVAFWAWIWGIVGALIAVPVLVAIKVACDHTDLAPWFAHFSSMNQAPVARPVTAGGE